MLLCATQKIRTVWQSCVQRKKTPNPQGMLRNLAWHQSARCGYEAAAPMN
jgi:hypothetical protein